MQDFVDYRETLKELREEIERAEISDISNEAEAEERDDVSRGAEEGIGVGFGGPRPSGVDEEETPHAMPEQGANSSFRITGEVPESCIDWEEQRRRVESQAG